MSYDIFISYSSSDLLHAETLYRKLLEVNFRVWFDKDRL